MAVRSSPVKMTTLAIGSEMDAAEALLELQRDNRESKYAQSCGKENKLPITTFLYNLIGSRSSLGGAPTSTSTPKTSPHAREIEVSPTYKSQNNKQHEIYKPHRKINNNNMKCKVMQEAVITKVWSDSSNDNLVKIANSVNLKQDKATQTEIEYQMPEIEKMETVIRELCSKIKALENRLKTKKTESSSLLDSVTDFNTDISNDDRSTRMESHYNGRRSYKRKRTSTTNTEFGDYNSNSANTTHVQSSNESDSEKDYCNSRKQLKTHLNSKSKNELVSIGDGNAVVPSKLMKNMDWSSYTNATRKLLTAVFSRKVLATHSLTGKPSPAFPDKPAKKKLNTSLVNDIVQTVVERCHVPESVVRTSITTKCADESKMFRSRQNKKKNTSKRSNRENYLPFKYASEDSDESYLSS